MAVKAFISLLLNDRECPLKILPQGHTSPAVVGWLMSSFFVVAGGISGALAVGLGDSVPAHCSSYLRGGLPSDRGLWCSRLERNQ
jgi:hypothetical protein